MGLFPDPLVAECLGLHARKPRRQGHLGEQEQGSVGFEQPPEFGKQAFKVNADLPGRMGRSVGRGDQDKVDAARLGCVSAGGLPAPATVLAGRCHHPLSDAAPSFGCFGLLGIFLFFKGKSSGADGSLSLP